MAIADNKALLNDIMDVVDDYVTAKASKELKTQIFGVLSRYEIATMITDDSGDVDNSKQLIDAFINAKIAEGLAYCYDWNRYHPDEQIEECKELAEDYIDFYWNKQQLKEVK